MPDPRTVELAQVLSDGHRYLGANCPLTELAAYLLERFIVVPADTARTGWAVFAEDGWAGGNSAALRPHRDSVDVIVAPDPRTEATNA